jgi:hypothetical protein
MVTKKPKLHDLSNLPRIFNVQRESKLIGCIVCFSFLFLFIFSSLVGLGGTQKNWMRRSLDRGPRARRAWRTSARKRSSAWLSTRHSPGKEVCYSCTWSRATHINSGRFSSVERARIETLGSTGSVGTFVRDVLAFV